MPTNLKSLLSRSRSRNELKLREKGDESCCELSNDGSGGSSGVGGPNSSSSSSNGLVGCQCQCSCHSSLSVSDSTSGMKKDSSCKSLFFSCGTLNGVGDVGIENSHCNASGSSSSSAGTSATTTVTTATLTHLSPSQQSLSMRKCETVLALSTLNGSVTPGLGSTTQTAPTSPPTTFFTSNSSCGTNHHSQNNTSSSSSSSANANTTKVTRVMKEKIFSTSSSTLNCLLHSSNRSKLFSGWKLSPNNNSAGSGPSAGSSSTSGGIGVSGRSNSPGASDIPSDHHFHHPRASSANSQSSINCLNMMSPSIAICQKSGSQLSVSTEATNGIGLGASGAPLTPINRLRRNVSVNNTNFVCPNSLTNSSCSRSSSVASFGWTKDDHIQEILCRLCLSNVGADDTVEILACSCRYCKDCVMAYVTFEIQEGAYDIACPDASCDKQGVLTLVEIENLVPDGLMEKYRKFRMYREVEKDGQLMWCPSPGCETVCRIQEASVLSSGSDSKAKGGGNTRSCSLPNISCSTCHKSYCAECKLSWHPDQSCEAFRRKLVKQGKLSLDDEDLFSLESIKKCPFCHVPIEKDSGCAQMMCKRCKHVFCWYCLASLDDDFLLRHYDKGPCKNKLGHSRASVVWHRAQVIGIFAGFGVLVLLASPLLILAAPCLLCCRCRYCANKLDPDESPVPV